MLFASNRSDISVGEWKSFQFTKIYKKNPNYSAMYQQGTVETDSEW